MTAVWNDPTSNDGAERLPAPRDTIEPPAHSLQHDLRCVTCGYGVVLSVLPAPRCPMCSGTTWSFGGTRRGEAGPSAGPA